MNLKLGIITRDIGFIYHIKDQLQALTNVDISSFHKEKDFDIILIDYDKAKDIYESLIAHKLIESDKIVIISKQALLNYTQPNKSIAPIIIHPNKISTKLLKLLACASSPEYILIKAQRAYYKIRYYDILMVYPENHYLNFVLETQTIKSRISIADISDELESHGFAISKASTYVNIHRITSISKHKVFLDSGKYTSISRYKYKSLIKKFKEEV